MQVVHNAGNQKRDYINHNINCEPIHDVLFTDFISKTIDANSKRFGKSYQKGYNTLIDHLLCFSSRYNCLIVTNSINEHFLSDFCEYLLEQDLNRNYIKHIVALVKSMASKAGENNYVIDPSFRNFVFEGEETFSIYLSKMDIAWLYHYPGLTKAEQRIRDLFVLGCLTGLRYSDYSKLKKENFDDDYLTRLTKKTKKKVKIPLHQIVKEIIEKYDGNVSRDVSIQHFNRYIKKICKKIGMDMPVKREIIKNDEIIIETIPKWKLVSSHVARRSAVTNMYNDGFSKRDIMNITGHVSERSLSKYIIEDQEQVISELRGRKYFRA